MSRQQVTIMCSLWFPPCLGFWLYLYPPAVGVLFEKKPLPSLWPRRWDHLVHQFLEPLCKGSSKQGQSGSFYPPLLTGGVIIHLGDDLGWFIMALAFPTSSVAAFTALTTCLWVILSPLASASTVDV